MSFSVSFLLGKDDLSAYDKKMKKAFLVLRLKKILLPFLFIVVLGLLFDISYVLTGVAFFLALMFLPDVINREYKNGTEKHSLLLRKPMTVEFYENHFVVRVKSDEISKCFSEKHYGFDTVISVFESEEHFFYIFSTNNILIIPKRALNSEQTEMLKAMIENLFSKIYRAV